MAVLVVHEEKEQQASFATLPILSLTMSYLAHLSCLAAVLLFSSAHGQYIHCISTVPSECDNEADDHFNRAEAGLFSALSGAPISKLQNANVEQEPVMGLSRTLDGTVRDKKGDDDDSDDEKDKKGDDDDSDDEKDKKDDKDMKKQVQTEYKKPEDEHKGREKKDKKIKMCKKKLDCLKEGVAEECSSDFGSHINRTVSWFSVLSTNTTGAINGMWYSGIPLDLSNPVARPFRALANEESPDRNGTSVYAQFAGTPAGNPLTTVMVRSAHRPLQLPAD